VRATRQTACVALGLAKAFPSQTANNNFIAEHNPNINWEWMLVLGNETAKVGRIGNPCYERGRATSG